MGIFGSLLSGLGNAAGGLLGGIGNVGGSILGGAGNLITQTVPKLLTNIPKLGSSVLSGLGNLLGGGGSGGGSAGGGGGLSLPNLLGSLGQAGSSLLGGSGGSALNNLLGSGLLLGSALRKDEPGEVGEARQFLRNQFTSPTATGDRLKEQVGGVQNAYGSYLQPNSTARQYLQSQFSDPNALASQFTGNVNALKGQFQPVLDQRRQRDIADISQRFAAAFPGSVGAQGPEFGTLSRYITDEALPREQEFLGKLGLDQLTRQQQAATQSLAADESQRNFVGQQAQQLTDNQQRAAGTILDTSKPDKLNDIMSLLGANLLGGGRMGSDGASLLGGVPGYGQPGYAGEGYANYPELYQQLYGQGAGGATGGGGLGGLLQGLLGGGGGLLSGATNAIGSLLSGGGLSGALQGLLGGGAQGATGLLSQLGLGGAPAGAPGGGIFGSLLGGSGSSALGGAAGGLGGLVAPALGAAGGYLLGSKIGQSIGSNQAQSALAGAAASGAAGFAIGGPVGGVIGAIAGGLGGLFGKSSAVKAQKEASIAAETASTNARRPAALQTAAELFAAANEFQAQFTATKPKIIGAVENLYYNVGDPEIRAIFDEVARDPDLGASYSGNVDHMIDGINRWASLGGGLNPVHAAENPESQMSYLNSWERGKFDAAAEKLTGVRDTMQKGHDYWSRIINRLNQLGVA